MHRLTQTQEPSLLLPSDPSLSRTLKLIPCAKPCFSRCLTALFRIQSSITITRRRLRLKSCGKALLQKFRRVETTILNSFPSNEFQCTAIARCRMRIVLNRREVGRGY
jgi:hypothetical protein